MIHQPGGYALYGGDCQRRGVGNWTGTMSKARTLADVRPGRAVYRRETESNSLTRPSATTPEEGPIPDSKFQIPPHVEEKGPIPDACPFGIRNLSFGIANTRARRGSLRQVDSKNSSGWLGVRPDRE